MHKIALTLILLAALAITSANAGEIPLKNKDITDGTVYITAEGPQYYTGKEMQFKNHMRELYYADGAPFTGTAAYYDDKHKLAYAYPYVDGKLNGILRTYFDNGQVRRETPAVNGQEQGPGTVYHENGRVAETRNFMDGQLHGIAKTYDAKGNLTSEIPYVHGQYHGEWKRYNSKGQIWSLDIYENGKLVESR